MHFEVLLKNNALYVRGGDAQQPRILCTWMHLKVLLNNHALGVLEGAAHQRRTLCI